MEVGRQAGGRPFHRGFDDITSPNATDSTTMHQAVSPEARARYQVVRGPAAPRSARSSVGLPARQTDAFDGAVVRDEPCRRTRRPHDLGGAVPARDESRLVTTSASHPSPATTVTAASPVRAERPVRGSTRWWCSAPSRRQVRSQRLLVATAPERSAQRPSSCPGAHGSSTATTHPSSVGARPSTRTSPPTFTEAPSAPASSRSATSMSAASPLPIPPGSNPVPGVSRAACPSSTKTTCDPDRARRASSGAPRASRVVLGSAVPSFSNERS